MEPVLSFHAFGTSHLAALALTVLSGVALIRFAQRSRDSTLVRSVEKALAIVLLVIPLIPAVRQSLEGAIDIQSAIPIQYCDIAAFAGAAALWSRRQIFCEVVYFFGLSGTVQGLITPALTEDFPAFGYFHFFIAHGLVVVIAFYVVLGMRHAPAPGAVVRMIVVMSLFAAVVGALNAALGTNYAFLCAKSPNPSLLDFFGPWPRYLVVLWFAGLFSYLLLDLPFWLARRRGVRRE
jgi:hypothetical integral membrane protein (TIGR02206 family)